MSWRTHSHYVGIGESEREWLRNFDRAWDGKDEGRSRTDAMEHLSGSGDDADQINRPRPAPSAHIKITANLPDYFQVDSSILDATTRAMLEAELLRVAANVARFTVPKPKKSGWSIHLIMKCGRRARAHFSSWDSAVQAYQALEELSLWFIAS